MGKWLELRKHHWRKPEGPRHRCGHEQTPENTIWKTRKWTLCKRCDEIQRILAAFERLDNAYAIGKGRE